MNKRKPIAKKKMTSKKPINRKVNPITKMTSALATVSIHQQKLLNTLFDKVCFEVRYIREFETSYYYAGQNNFCPGSVIMNLNTTNPASQFWPVHVYDLTTIVNDGIGAPMASVIGCNASEQPYVVQTYGTPILTGANDGGTFTSQQNLNRALMNYFNVKLQLFQRDKFSTKYTVQLIKILDEQLVPATSASGTLLRHNAFWKQMARQYFTNDFAPSDTRIMNDLKSRFKVIWSKDYNLKEKLNDADGFQSKTVNIFKRVNEIKVFNENPPNIVYGNDNPEDISVPTTSGTSTTKCRLNQRYYLIVRSNATQDVNTTGLDSIAPSNLDLPSYNFYFKSCYTVPQSGV